MTKSNKIIRLIGKNLSSSRSLELHNAIYKHFDLPLEYQLCDCGDICQVKSMIDSSQNSYMLANITFPYKHDILEVLPRHLSMDDASKFCRGINLLLMDQTKCNVFNFDGLGFVLGAKSLFYSEVFSRIENSKVVVFGTGITANSLKYAFNKYGAMKVSLIKRENGEQHSSTNQLLSEADIVINATPVGKFKENFNMNLMDNYDFKDNQIAIDVVYRDELTPFLVKAKNQGAFVLDGRVMLAGQAALSVIEICKFFDIQDKVWSRINKKSFSHIEPDSIRRNSDIQDNIFDTIFNVAYKAIL